jgi:beta-1,4-N-acetylglucosaminyltransferase
MKICLECSEGGHLDEMLCILDAFSEHEIFFILTKVGRTEDLCKRYRVKFIKRRSHHNKINIIFDLVSLIPFCLANIIIEKPDVIVSTGGNAIIPLSYIGKAFGITIIYIESLTRVDDISGTGKIVYPVADLFLIQWKHLLEKYKKAEYWGKVV